MSSTPRNIVAAALAVAVAALALVLVAITSGPAAADEHCGQIADDGALVICVRDDEFVPADPEPIEVGEKVRWVWLDGSALRGHTVTGEPGDGEGAFDSDRDCPEEDESACRREGHEYEWVAAKTGTFDYFCEVSRNRLTMSEMAATLEVVAPPPSPSPSPSSSPSPSPSPTEDPPPSPTPETSPSPTSEPSPEGESSPSPEGGSSAESSSPSRQTQQRSAPRMRPRSRPLETDGEEPVGEVEPEVAAPDATFSPFPSPEPLPTGEPGDEDLGELVIGASDGPFTPTRTQWVGLAFASLAVSAGAFAKVVFLGGTFG